MKQKEIVFNDDITDDGAEMVTNYWAIVNINEREEFLITEKEFSNRYRGMCCFQELKNIKSFAIYHIENCSICDHSFDVIINDRLHLEEYSRSNYKLCMSCSQFHSVTQEILYIRLDGDIGK